MSYMLYSLQFFYKDMLVIYHTKDSKAFKDFNNVLATLNEQIKKNV